MSRRRARGGPMGERALMELVWRLPRKVIAWALIRAWAHASSGPWSDEAAPELSMELVVRRWDQPHDDEPTRPGWLRRLMDPQRATLEQHRDANLAYAVEKLNRELPVEEWFTVEDVERLAEHAVTPTRRAVSPVQVAQYLRVRLAAGASLEQAVYEVRDPANSYLVDPIPAELS